MDEVRAPLDIQKATPELLYQYWPTIRDGLLEVKAFQGPHCHWEPEHVRAYVLSNNAEMWLCFNAGKLDGFFVTTQFPDPYLNVNLFMFVWIAFAKGPGFAEGMAFLEKLARTRGLRGLETISPRAGESRLLAPFGWYPAQVVYRKDFDQQEAVPLRRLQARLKLPAYQRPKRVQQIQKPEESKSVH